MCLKEDGASSVTDDVLFKKKIFIWLHWVLVAVHEVFSCGMWDFVPWVGITPEPPALEGRVLATGPPGKSLKCF